MKDKLEDFINHNREKFDSAEPSLNIWANLEQQLDQITIEKPDNVIPMKARTSRRSRLYRYVRVAAIALVCLMVGGVVGSYVTASKMENPTEVALRDVSQEYAEIEEHYARQVSSTFNELRSYDYDKSIENDMAELDITYEKLRKELALSPDTNNEQIINAMIENYQLKVAILERVLIRLKSPSGQTENSTNSIEL